MAAAASGLCAPLQCGDAVGMRARPANTSQDTRNGDTTWNGTSDRPIVTGGAGGLGAATVRNLTALGMQVVVFDRALDAGKELVSDLGRGAAVGGDVNDDADVTAAIDAASALAPLAVVVNVAGGGAGGRTLSRDNTPLDMSVFRGVMELNAFGTFNVTRLAAVADGRQRSRRARPARGGGQHRLDRRLRRDRRARSPTARPRRPFWA